MVSVRRKGSLYTSNCQSSFVSNHLHTFFSVQCFFQLAPHLNIYIMILIQRHRFSTMNIFDALYRIKLRNGKVASQL
jgi:hypothetical protein